MWLRFRTGHRGRLPLKFASRIPGRFCTRTARRVDSVNPEADLELLPTALALT